MSQPHLFRCGNLAWLYEAYPEHSIVVSKVSAQLENPLATEAMVQAGAVVLAGVVVRVDLARSFSNPSSFQHYHPQQLTVRLADQSPGSSRYNVMAGGWFLPIRRRSDAHLPQLGRAALVRSVPDVLKRRLRGDLCITAVSRTTRMATIEIIGTSSPPLTGIPLDWLAQRR